MPRIKPKAAGLEASVASQCYAASLDCGRGPSGQLCIHIEQIGFEPFLKLFLTIFLQKFMENFSATCRCDETLGKRCTNCLEIFQEVLWQVPCILMHYKQLIFTLLVNNLIKFLSQVEVIWIGHYSSL